MIWVQRVVVSVSALLCLGSLAGLAVSVVAAQGPAPQAEIVSQIEQATSQAKAAEAELAARHAGILSSVATFDPTRVASDTTGLSMAATKQLSTLTTKWPGATFEVGDIDLHLTEVHGQSYFYLGVITLHRVETDTLSAAEPEFLVVRMRTVGDDPDQRVVQAYDVSPETRDWLIADMTKTKES